MAHVFKKSKPLTILRHGSRKGSFILYTRRLNEHASAGGLHLGPNASGIISLMIPLAHL
jgi:hypothetical protein